MHKLSSIFLLIILVLSGCCKNNGVITIALDYSYNTNYIGILVAMEKGFYKEKGLDIRLNQASEISVEAQVNNNQADYGFSYSENVIMANSQGMNLASIYALFTQNLSGFISQSDKNITTINDFSQKNYCGWGSDAERKIIQGLMQEQNLDPNSVKFINTDLNITTDINQSCDIFWSYEYWGNLQAQNNGINYNYIPLSSLGLSYYTPVIISNQNYNPNTKNFIDATNLGYIYAINNIDDAVDIYKKYDPTCNPKMIKDSLMLIKPYINQNGYQQPDIWNNFLDFANKYLTNNFSASEVYTNEFINN